MSEIVDKLHNDHAFALRLGIEANKTANKYTWERFRQGIVNYTNELTG